MSVYMCVRLYVDRQRDRDRDSLVDCQDISWGLIGKKKMVNII